jgi:hypothetical protein
MTRPENIQAIREVLVPREHYSCDDSWYSCPKSEDGCSNQDYGSDCICGADEHNSRVIKALAALDELAAQDAELSSGELMALDQQWADMHKAELDVLEARAEKAESEAKALRVCGNCAYGKSTSLDDTRCYKATPYTPTGRHCAGCVDWSKAPIITNPRVALSQGEEE